MTHIMKLRLAGLTVLLIATLIAPLFSPGLVLAAEDSQTTACNTLGNLNPEGGDCNNPGGVKIDNLIRQIINILSFIGGVVAVIMLIVGGLKYITSQGDATKATSSRQTILYALVGLVVVALAQVIVKFVVGKGA